MQIAFGVFVIVLVLYYFASRGDAPGQIGAEEAEGKLLRLCLGDRKQAERLLALEMKKSPSINRSEAVRRAVRSLRRDVK